MHSHVHAYYLITCFGDNYKYVWLDNVFLMIFMFLMSLQQNVFSVTKIFVTKSPVFRCQGPLATKSTN